MALLLSNATLSLGGGRWSAGDVLVGDGRIIAVRLSDDGSDPLPAGPDVTVRDLGGASVLPGFHDTHVHPPLSGSALLGIDLMPVHDAAAYAEIIAHYADAHPDEAVLEGVGWYGDVFEGGFPTRWQLDAIVDDRPVVLTSHDGHGVWVNSRALEAAGVGDDVSDPVGGRFLRDTAGRLTGVLLDTAMDAVAGIRPAPRDDAIAAAILAAQERMHSVGITAWHDAAVGASDIGADAFEVYLDLDARGLLTANVTACLWWRREEGLAQISELEDRRRRAAAAGGRVVASTVKIMQDGMIENLTAAMLEPYSTTPGSTGPDSTDGARRGDSLVDPAELKTIVTELDARGFPVHLHAVGDRAVRECLDAIEAARTANGPSDNRHQITHLDVVDAADVPRFAALDVTANAQLLWGRLDTEIVERKLPLMGPDRARRHFPYGTLHRAGARIAAGSDWPVSDPNPLWALHTGTTRTAPAGDPHATGDALTVPLLPEEALPFDVALDAFTGVAAWVGHAEDRTGFLRPGYAADIVVLDRDISDGTALDAARVVETLSRGVTVYRAD
jgi:predicted amidohydrolase YtcJ